MSPIFQRLTELARELEAQGQQVGLMVSSELMQYWQDQAIDSVLADCLHGKPANPGNSR